MRDVAKNEAARRALRSSRRVAQTLGKALRHPTRLLLLNHHHLKSSIALRSSYSNMKDIMDLIRDPDAMHEYLNKLYHHGLKGATPEEGEFNKEVFETMDQFLEEFKKVPPGVLPPETYETHRWLLQADSNRPKYMEQIRRGNKPPELIKRENRVHNEVIDRVLKDRPSLMAMQRQIDSLLGSSEEPRRFNLPAVLNSIAKHHNRKQLFVMMDVLTPSDEAITARLIDLRNTEPAIHMQLIQILVQASLLEKLVHAKNCACLLCTHMKDSLTPVSSSAGAKKHA